MIGTIRRVLKKTGEGLPSKKLHYSGVKWEIKKQEDFRMSCVKKD